MKKNFLRIAVALVLCGASISTFGRAMTSPNGVSFDGIPFPNPPLLYLVDLSPHGQKPPVYEHDIDALSTR